MDVIQNNKIINKIIRYHHQHPWIWLYMVSLLVLIAWGNLSVKIFPLVESNIGLPSEITYENVAPGWASHGIFRSLLDPWLRWDTVWYLLVAKQGYSISGVELAFPPLYPFLIRIIAKLFGGQYLLASLIISWSSVFGSCFLLEARFTQMTDPKTAVRGIRNLLIFPTAFFFFAGYTEALFLFFVLLIWRYADRGQWFLAGLVGALATMTRAIGVVLVVPIGLIWLENWRKNSITDLLSLLLLPIAYFGWSQFASSTFDQSPFNAQTIGWFSHFDWPWVGIIGNLSKVFSLNLSETLSDFLNILVVLVVFYSIIWWLKRKLYPESMFMATFILVSLIKITDTGLLGSVSRFVIPLFPVYLVLAELGKNTRFDRVILVILIFLWLFYSALFFTWNWVA